MKKVLLLATTLIAVTIVALSVKQSNNRVKYSEKESKEKDNDAIGMAAYMNKLMCDPATGKMDLVAYYNAMKEAQAFAAARTSSGLGLQWYSLGPDNIGGRTRAILFDKNNSNRLYAAGVTGGLWLSSNGGQSWVELQGADQWQNINIASICQDDSGYIYCGTGEGLAGLLSSYGNIGGAFVGYGMWKSTTPSGTVFSHLQSTTPTTTTDNQAPWSEVNRLAANPNSADSLFAAIQGGASRGGLQLSTNGGKTWITPSGIPPSAFQGTDVKFSSDGKKVFAALNTIGGPGQSTASLYYSSNGGRSFTRQNGGGFPKAGTTGAIGRIEIAVSPTNPNFAYATVINISDGSLAYVVQTRDGGVTWNTIGTGTGFKGYYDLNGFDPTGPQGVYDLTMAVSPIDSNMLFVGGTTLWRWTPTESWSQISFYGSEEFYTVQHSDMHALVFDPTNSNRLIIGSDGGITQTLNPYASATSGNGVQYTSLNRNYNVTQFYSVSADSEARTFGGTQDNSNERINFLGNTVKSADLVFGGDGGATQIASNGTSFFAGVPGSSSIGRSSNRGNSWGSAFDHFADSIAGVAGGAQFIEPFYLWEAPDSLHIRDSLGKLPKQSLMAVGLNNGRVLVSPSANNFGTTPSWFELQTDTGNITAVTISPDGQDLYVGTDVGYIYRYSGFDSVFIKNRWKYPLSSTNHITIVYVWNAADSGIVKVRSSYLGFYSSLGRVISSISVDPNNKDRVVVTAANYGSTITSWVARSTNATTGFTFIPIPGTGSTALPKGPVYSSCIPHNGAILVGTQYGIYSSEDNGATWALENNSILPNTPVMGIRELPYYHSNAIYAASYGRGLWTSYTLTDQTGINTIKASTVANLTVFPNPLSSKGHIQYTLAKQGNVVVDLYDIQGRLVKAIANENMNVGPIDIQFNASDLVSGTYIVDVVQGQNRATAKLAVVH